MNTTISNNGLPKLPQPATGQGSGSTQGTSSTTSSDAVGSSTGSTDRVQITDSARALQEAARTNSGATMDTKKSSRSASSWRAAPTRSMPARLPIA